MNQSTVNTARSGDISGVHRDILDRFIKHLRTTMSERWIHRLRLDALHFLIWLEHCGRAIESIDNAVLCTFHRHDCHCPGMERERKKRLASGTQMFMKGVLKLVCFLEDQGHIPHPGELAANLCHLDRFIMRCQEQGYRPRTLRRYRNSCRHALVWLHRSRISIMDIGTETLQDFLNHDCVCGGTFKSIPRHKSGHSYEGPFLRFLQSLEETGVLPVRNVVPGTAVDPVMEQFAVWLRHHRGISERTIHEHSRLAAMLVADLDPDPRMYDAAGIREVLLRHYAGVSCSQARHLASSMRMYLRYLATAGHCSPFLVDAVPTATTWRLASLPRHISPEQVEHVIACCDVSTPSGLRDRAIILLLARLALRAGDIVAMQLEDIDWKSALVRVCGKSGRQDALPLPQDVGDAILDYIDKARPRIAEDRLFLCMNAPHRPLGSNSIIAHVAKSAMKRAGLDLDVISPHGSHIFRHSVATNMLRSGSSLETISTLLRHKSMETTTIYAKTDTPMLLGIAQPWIGGAS